VKSTCLSNACPFGFRSALSPSVSFPLGPHGIGRCRIFGHDSAIRLIGKPEPRPAPAPPGRLGRRSQATPLPPAPRPRGAPRSDPLGTPTITIASWSSETPSAVRARRTLPPAPRCHPRSLSTVSIPRQAAILLRRTRPARQTIHRAVGSSDSISWPSVCCFASSSSPADLARMRANSRESLRRFSRVPAVSSRRPPCPSPDERREA